MLLILSQHPTAERVAGFRAWLALGYCPVKGSKAIRIWAPCPPSKAQLQVWREAGADPAHKPRTGWRLAAVFAQDDVAELPPPAVPAPLTAPIAEICGDSHQELITALTDLAGEVGYQVVIEDTGRVDGYCNPKGRRIAVAARLEPNGRLVALIHELAHALVAEIPTPPRWTTRKGS